VNDTLKRKPPGADPNSPPHFTSQLSTVAGVTEPQPAVELHAAAAERYNEPDLFT
jgi:hypothetical protein